MEKTSHLYFKYPPNLAMLDLATMVSMYRKRGEIRKADTGSYFGCSVTHKLIKSAKSWFGIYYSQKAWDTLLSRNSGGYPLTEAELNILGLAMEFQEEGLVNRQYAENNCGVVPKLAFMIVNDLKEFGFLTLHDNDKLKITPAGVQALQGICRHIYSSRFKPEMLLIWEEDDQPRIEEAKKKRAEEQTSLF